MNEVLSKNEELESHCHRLETEKYKLEESLLSAKDATQKEESKRNEAECEAKRLSILLEKVRLILIFIPFSIVLYNITRLIHQVVSQVTIQRHSQIRLG